jgi:D-glucosaminate-6-phosphate ammonia-lyase
VAEELATTKPRIALGGGGGAGRGQGTAADSGSTSVSITAWMMKPEDVKIVADRLHAVPSQKRSPKAASTPAPAANLSGRWDVNIEFFSSKSQHTLYLTQDGNRVQGSHKGDFSTRDVFGTIEGDQIKLRSQLSQPGDSVGFIFGGTLAGDTFSGNIYMGEYLNAKFTAKRYSYPARQGTAIRIPIGPPLAN